MKGQTETNEERVLILLHGELKTPPMSSNARIEAGTLLRRLQRGELIGLPASRPMPSIGKRCGELRVQDENVTWRIMYRVDCDAVIVMEVFDKKTQATPKHIIETCKNRLAAYDALYYMEV